MQVPHNEGMKGAAVLLTSHFSNFISVEGFHIQDIKHWLACQETAQVLAEEIGEPCVLAVAGAGRMGADQHVGHLPERAALRQWLLGEDIERCTAKVTSVKGGDQRRLVD